MGVAEGEHVAVGAGGDAFERAGRLVLEQVLVDLARRSVDEPHSVVAQVEAAVERQAAHEVLGAPVGVRERPLDRPLAQFAVVAVAVGAAAVLEIAADGVVVVAVDRGDCALLDQGADLVRVRAVAHQVAAAVDGVYIRPLDRLEYGLEGRQVGVDVGDDRDPLHRRPQSKH
jgi:hypothetical protein